VTHLNRWALLHWVIAEGANLRDRFNYEAGKNLASPPEEYVRAGMSLEEVAKSECPSDKFNDRIKTEVGRNLFHVRALLDVYSPMEKIVVHAMNHLPEQIVNKLMDITQQTTLGMVKDPGNLYPEVLSVTFTSEGILGKPKDIPAPGNPPDGLSIERYLKALKKGPLH